MLVLYAARAHSYIYNNNYTLNKKLPSTACSTIVCYKLATLTGGTNISTSFSRGLFVPLNHFMGSKFFMRGHT